MEFRVENYRGVENVKIRASHGDLVVIAGKNGAGKSSFIGAITELFDPRGVKLTPKPIREGQKKATAEFTDEDLDVRIKRTWTKDNAGTLEVHALDGAKYKQPSQVLAELTGGLIFDPGAFLMLDEKKQREALLEKVDLPFDLDDLERQREGAEARRRDVGRDVKRIKGALETMETPEKGLPDTEVSAGDIVAEISAAEAEHRLAAQQDRDLEAAKGVREQLEQQLADIQAAIATNAEQIDSLEFEIGTRGELPDLDGIQARLGDLESTNAKIRAKREYTRLAEELAQKEASYEAEQMTLADIAQQKLDGLAEAAWPDPALSVDDDGVLLEGVPFRQCNTARKILAAARIATSGDPQLKLVIISNGDMLDGDSLDMVRELAEERGFTVLIERDRDESREIGFTIEEGNLAE